jgi:hypothetical protein
VLTGVARVPSSRRRCLARESTPVRLRRFLDDGETTTGTSMARQSRERDSPRWSHPEKRGRSGWMPVLRRWAPGDDGELELLQDRIGQVDQGECQSKGRRGKAERGHRRAGPRWNRGRKAVMSADLRRWIHRFREDLFGRKEKRRGRGSLAFYSRPSLRRGLGLGERGGIERLAGTPCRKRSPARGRRRLWQVGPTCRWKEEFSGVPFQDGVMLGLGPLLWLGRIVSPAFFSIFLFPISFSDFCFVSYILQT